jgi:hypothetical protein
MCALPLAILLAVFFVFPVSSSAQPIDPVRNSAIKADMKSAESGKHFTHSLPRPSDFGDFASLEDWIKANYTIYLVPDSITHGVQDGHDTTSFFTVGDDGIYDHHIFSDTGEGFVLQTTANLKVPGEGETNTLGFARESQNGKAIPMVATAASSSCGQYACLCAAYARCIVPSLPSTSLSYYTEKLKAINWPYPGSPSIGAVAVMQITMPFGHMGVINNMWWSWHGYTADLIVQLNEANYAPPGCRITYNRSGKPGDLHIVGYFRP